jgi:hypothetical protein
VTIKKYRHFAPVWDNKQLIPAGTIFEFEGTPGRDWEHLDDDDNVVEKPEAPRRGRPPSKPDTVEAE